MDLRLRVEPWLPEAISALKMLARLGYRITDDHIALAVTSAVTLDAGPADDDED
jgi:hypothetical protein